jgi:tetratricopeptide (TPR) repeat protein
VKKHSLVVLIALFLVPASVGHAADAIKTVGSTPVIQGKISSVTAQKVVIEARGAEKVVPVNEIVSIAFDGEPSAVRNARTGIAAKNYEDVITALDKVQVDSDTRKEIVQDIQFYKAVCMGRMAIAGRGEIVPAATAVNAFLARQHDSYHYYEACELMGDLAVANRRYSSAAGFYGKLFATPWPNYQLRAGLAMGRAYQAEKKPAEALQAFEKALAVKVPENDPSHAIAMAGKAQCLAETGKPEEALKIAQEVIDKISSEETEVHAYAYVALGTAYRALKKPKEAMLAFLHVELLYNSASDAHAQSLANLVHVWNDLKQPDRAERARDTLTEQYKNSPWAQQP